VHEVERHDHEYDRDCIDFHQALEMRGVRGVGILRRGIEVDPRVEPEKRRAEDQQREQEADEQLQAGAGIFEAFAAEARSAPDVFPDAGLAPEPIDAERQDSEQHIYNE